MIRAPHTPDLFAQPSARTDDELRDMLRDLSNHARTSTPEFWRAARALALRQQPKPKGRNNGKS
jgi:hypothetical protein